MGMPFPNPTDPELCERMRFLDTAASSTTKSMQHAGEAQHIVRFHVFVIAACP